MEFLLCFLIFIVSKFIYNNIKIDPVCKYSPAHPEYTCKKVTIEVLFKGTLGQLNDVQYTFKELYYVHNSLTHNEICDYVFKHRDLYLNELLLAKKHFSNQYKATPVVTKITISINN